MTDAARNLVMAISFWGYLALLPLLTVAVIYHGFIRRKE
jgi:uncharacterized BrkB/YihY/UPF0761 family membrane protein